MKIKFYSIKDNLTGFKQPFSAPNDAFAMRMLAQLVNDDQKNDIMQSPADYQLFFIGTMDEDTAEFVSDVKFLVNAIDLKHTVLKSKEEILAEIKEKSEEVADGI